MKTLLAYELFRHSLIAGVIIGVLLPLVGTIVLFRRMTFVADSFGHINMTGIAFAMFLTSIFPTIANFSFVIAVIWTILSAILIEFLRNKYKDYKELSITIVYSISIALMMIFLSLANGYNSSLFSILFGNINGINSYELIQIILWSVLILVLFKFNYKKILLLSLEEEYSKLYGVNVKYTKYLLMILIALSITIAIKTIGVLLVSSLMIIPLLTASNIANTLKSTTIFAIIFSEISMISGIYLSYYLNLPTSALIVLIAIIIYLFSFKWIAPAKRL